MRFTLYIDTDRAPEGPVTWAHLLDLARGTLERIDNYCDGAIEPLPLTPITDYSGSWIIGGYKVTKK